MKVIKKVFEKISGQKIFSPQISRKKIFNRKIFTYKPGTIQATLMIAFSVVSAVILLCMGSVMYLRFSSMSQKEILENNQRLMGSDRREGGRLSDQYAAGIGCLVL